MNDQKEVKEETNVVNFQDAYMRGVLEDNQFLGMELLRLNRPDIFAPKNISKESKKK